MSLATEPNTGAVVASLEAHFADDDERRLQLLDWLEAHGYGSTPQDRIPAEVYEQARRELGHPEPAEAPAVKTFTRPPHTEVEQRAQPLPAQPAPAENETPGKPATEAETMDGKKCTKCGKALRSDNKRGLCGNKKACEARGGGKRPAASPARARAAPKRAATSRELAGLEVEDLLELRSEVDGELKRRRDEAEEQLSKLTAALGAAA